jgi:aryl sulfotransferase
VPDSPVRYQSDDEDSARWLGFPFRSGDIVISTRSKSGTTWMQMICALLVFQTPKLPAPLVELSPWVDWLTQPREQMLAGLADQQHRRFVKTHTPLDGVPVDPHATYLVVARHPLDSAVSLYHQGDNIDRARLRELTGQPEPTRPPRPRPSLHDWLVRWIDRQSDPREEMDSLPGVMWHLSDAWSRRAESNVVLVHYDDLIADLDGEMRRLASLLGVSVPRALWPDLVQAATFDEMRANARRTIPSRDGVLKDTAAFFRRGTSGAGREVLSDDEVEHYYARTTSMASASLLRWLHRRKPA